MLGISHIFYQHQDLFEKQRVVDELVQDLALTLDVSRDDLNIVSSHSFFPIKSNYTGRCSQGNHIRAIACHIDRRHTA
jgi:hypothetical protein